MSNEDPGEGPSGTKGDSANSVKAFNFGDWVHDYEDDPSKELELSKSTPEIEPTFDNFWPFSFGSRSGGPPVGDFHSYNFGSKDDGGAADNSGLFDLGNWGNSANKLDDFFKNTSPDCEMVPASRLREVEQDLSEARRLLKESERLRRKAERRYHRAVHQKMPQQVRGVGERGSGSFDPSAQPVWEGNPHNRYDYVLDSPTTPSVSSITEVDVPRAVDSLLQKLGEGDAAEGETGPPNGDMAASPNRHDAASPGFYEIPPPNSSATPAIRVETAPPDRGRSSSPDREGTPSSDEDENEEENGDENEDETYAPTPPPTDKRHHQSFTAPQRFGSSNAGLAADRTPSKPSKSQPQNPDSGSNAIPGVDFSSHQAKAFGGKTPRIPPQIPFSGIPSQRHPTSDGNSSNPKKRGKDPENSDDSEDSGDEAKSGKRAKKEAPSRVLGRNSLGNPPHRSLGGKSLPGYPPFIGSSSKPISKRKTPENAEDGTESRKRSKKEDPDAIYDSETGQKLKKGQWRRSKLRAVYEILKEEDGNGGTSASLWERVTQRYCARFPDDYKENPEKAEGAMKNAWNRYGRALFNYEERKRKINMSLSTSSQTNRKKQGKNRERDVTPADANSPIQDYLHRRPSPRPPQLLMPPPQLPLPPRPDPVQEHLVAQERFDSSQHFPHQQPHLTQGPLHTHQSFYPRRPQVSQGKLPDRQPFYPQPPHLNQGHPVTGQPLTPTQFLHPGQPPSPQGHIHQQNLPTDTYGSLEEPVLSTMEDDPFNFDPFTAPL